MTIKVYNEKMDMSTYFNKKIKNEAFIILYASFFYIITYLFSSDFSSAFGAASVFETGATGAGAVAG